MTLSDLTEKQRAVLLAMANGDWHLGAAVATSGGTLAALSDMGLIRGAGEDTGYIRDMWTITPMAEKMLEVGE